MSWGIVGGIIYFVLLVTLGVISIRKGHWIMFLVGLFIPIFWFIGALMPSTTTVSRDLWSGVRSATCERWPGGSVSSLTSARGMPQAG